MIIRESREEILRGRAEAASLSRKLQAGEHVFFSLLLSSLELRDVKVYEP